LQYVRATGDEWVARDRPPPAGVALFSALSLLALLGLLVAGGFATSLLDRRSAGVARTDAELSTAADYALQAVLAGWQTYGLADLQVGENAVGGD
jgi:Tfp pilus assembly protein PilX